MMLGKILLTVTLSVGHDCFNGFSTGLVEKGDLSAGRLAGFWHRVTFTVEKDKSLVGSKDAGDSSAVVESCQKSVQVAGLEFFPDLAHRGCHVPAGCLPEPNALASGVVVLGLGVGG